MHDEILRLRSEGLSASEISKRVGVHERTVHYHLSGSRYTLYGIINRKIDKFEAGHRSGKISRHHKFNRDRAIKKIISNPNCYLSGRPIDLSDRKSWSLDHKKPRSKGGDNSLGNMGVASRIANQAKGDMSVIQFIEMCREVLVHNGYVVYKK